jgi:hypothetical protein
MIISWRISATLSLRKSMADSRIAGRALGSATEMLEDRLHDPC